MLIISFIKLPPPGEIGYENVSISIYHDYIWWRQFANSNYSRELDRDGTHAFKSKYKELGDWVDEMDFTIQRPFLPGKYDQRNFHATHDTLIF